MALRDKTADWNRNAVMACMEALWMCVLQAADTVLYTSKCQTTCSVKGCDYCQRLQHACTTADMLEAERSIDSLHYMGNMAMQMMLCTKQKVPRT